MLVYISLIFIAWFVVMPLWLAISLTVISVIGMVAKLIKFGMALKK